MIVNRTYDVSLRNNGKDLQTPRLRIKWCNSHSIVVVSLPCKVSPKGWNKDEGRCKPRSFHGRTTSTEINRLIEEYISKADEVFSRYEVREHTPTKDEFRNSYRLLMNGVSDGSITLADAMARYVDANKVSLSDGSIGVFHYQRNIIKRQYADTMLHQVDGAWLDAFVDDLVKKEQSNKTISNKVNHIKSVLLWARNQGIYQGDAHQYKLRLKMAQNNKVSLFLTWDELMRLYHLELDGEYDRIRDFFCFCSFTSLRISDVAQLKKHSVVNGKIHLTIKKTNKPVSVDLNKYSSAIIEKYADDRLIGDALLPSYHTSTETEKLKTVCLKANIVEMVSISRMVGNKMVTITKPKYEMITFHAARRTFVVNALSMGIPPSVVMQWTGHADYESMKPYINIADDAKRQEMDKFNK